MTPATVLREAAKLVRKGWCQGVNALDANGDETIPTCNDAVSWCLEGAVYASARSPEHIDEAYAAARRALETDSYLYPITWNDTPGRTAEEVAAALEKAAALAESPQPEGEGRKP